MRNKQSEKTEITKERILAAAEKEFSEKGYFGARVDAIAALSGVNKRMIYEHFVNKEVLYEITLLAVYERLAECERAFIIDDLDPVLAIKNIIYVYFRFLEENPSFVRMLMWENLNHAKALGNEKSRALKEPAFTYIKKQIRRGKEQGIFRQDIDEYQIVVSMMNFGFSYFSNMHTLSVILDRDMSAHEQILRRADFVSNMMIKYLVV